MSIKDLINKLEIIKASLSKEGLSKEELQTKYLGKKGVFNTVAKDISKVDDKKKAGQLLNEFKLYLTKQIEKIDSKDSSDAWIDLTTPATKPKVGHVHPISQAMTEITRIFERIGFTRARYPEVDWDWYVFESLNMPKSHPARDEWETFFINAKEDKKMGKMVLTTHTSKGQVHEMQRVESKAPIRMINIGRC